MLLNLISVANYKVIVGNGLRPIKEAANLIGTIIAMKLAATALAFRRHNGNMFVQCDLYIAAFVVLAKE